VGHEIDVLQSGSSVNIGDIGPHLLPTGYSYDVTTFKNLGGGKVRPVNCGYRIEKTTGLVTISKSAKVPDFDGSVLVVVDP